MLHELSQVQISARCLSHQVCSLVNTRATNDDDMTAALNVFRLRTERGHITSASERKRSRRDSFDNSYFAILS